MDRIVTIIQANPNKERIDKVITRWIKRHLQQLGAEVSLEQLNEMPFKEIDKLRAETQH
ncbi:hypothetical protein [Halomonas sp. SpR8]|uniref:hypothetical protein n=1 Tax=Halomonas sp. SpR8 TaxID=3050463 RepID=UPI0027E501F5|nr:hypothetical protein [Halomonas sp. SpR8]MDQ7728497.1 hypothetical protein [Halomonas sp. SpR8]